MSDFWWLAGAGFVIAGLIFYGKIKWRSFTDQMQDQLEAHHRPKSQVTLDKHDLEVQPDPRRGTSAQHWSRARQ